MEVPEKFNILLVDDTPSKLEAVASILERLEQNIICANSGREALKLVLKHDFSVILLDIKMPEMDGLETAEFIRSHKRSQLTPIIFITSYEHAEVDMVRSYAAGVTDLILWPVSSDLLCAKVKTFIDLKKALVERDYLLKHLENLVAERTAMLENSLQELRQKEDRLNTFFNAVDQSSALIVVTDINGNIEYTNKSFRKLSGYSETEITGKNMKIFKSGVHPPEYIGSFWNTIKSGESWKGNWCNKKKNGELYWTSALVSPVKDQSGNIIRFVETKEDITLQKHREDELRRLSLAVRKSLSPVMITDKNGTIEYVNPKFCEVTGYMLEEVIGQTPKILKSGQHPQWFYANLWRTIKSGKEWSADICNKKKNGELYWEYQSIHPVLDDVGNIINFVSVRIEDTERKNAERKLKRDAEELAKSNRDLEDFASFASHDLQEPLRKIIAFGGRLLENEKDLKEESRDYLGRIQKASARMSGLIESLLSLSKVNTKINPFAPVDLNKVIDEVKQVLAFKIEKTGGIIDVGPLPEIDADYMQMCQLFQNLIANALKFHHKGIPPHVSVEGRRNDMNQWEITVKDNGIGFDEKYTDRIFKPFERLHGKSAYEGSGIGLAICKKIVDRHNGTITVKSAPGEGTVFTVTLTGKQPIEPQKRDEKAD